MKNKYASLLLSLSVLLFAVFYMSSCKKQDIKVNTTTDVNIVSYLEQHSDSFSLFKQILDRTETSAFLNAYGAYTVFAPTNAGVREWLASVGAASVEVADLNTLKELVKFHIIADTIGTTSFKDGRLNVPTMQGQYIITGVNNKSGLSSFTVNRQATVTQSNIRAGNGIIHAIDHMLIPAKLTIAQQLEANPNYSIFVQALKETGFYTMLNTVDADTAKRWKTVIAESNTALKDSGFTTYAALKARFSKTGNPANPVDSLNIYVAYHIINGVNFLGDIINYPSLITLQPQEVITTDLINEQVVLNESEIVEGVFEKGILLVRASSDNAATNGVWHEANAHFYAKFRKPTAVYWDLAKFPEIVKLTSYYKKRNYTFIKNNQADRPIKDIDWHYQGEQYVAYTYSTTGSTTNWAVNYDVLQIPLGGGGNTNRATWVEFKTPPVIKGRYKVWLCYRNDANVIVQAIINGQLMPNQANLSQRYPDGSDAELESLGWKRYTSAPVASNVNFTGKLLGTIDIKTTERQTIRFEAVANTNRTIWWDMIHFIPVDQPQFLPRFSPDGTKVYQ